MTATKQLWRLLAVLLAFTLIAAACGDDDPAGEGPGEVGGEASGEVLGGTISDDMIPLDQLTSTSPPAPTTAATATWSLPKPN